MEPRSVARGRPELMAKLGPVLVMLAAVLAYLPALGCGFIWDDDHHLLEDVLINAPDGWWKVWWPPAHGTVANEHGAWVWNYWPVTRSLLWLERTLWGHHPAGFHLVNLLLHAGNAALLLRILLRLRVPGALLGAAIFAVHPVMVETAAWVTQHKNTVSTLFCFLSLCAWLRWHEAAPARPGAWWLALFLFLLALLAKTSTVMLPVVLVWIHWHQRWPWSRAGLLRLLPFFLCSAVMAGASIWYERTFIGSTGSEWQLSLQQRGALAGQIVVFYLWKDLLPLALSFNYPRWEIDASDPVAWLPTAGVLAAAVLLWCRREGWLRHVAFGLAYFLVSLFPVLGFFNVYGMRYAWVADHWQYLACPGVLALVAAGLAWLGRRMPARPAALAAALLVVVLGAMSWHETGFYRDRETLYRRTIAVEPRSWLARNNLGSLLLERGDWQEARTQLQAAIASAPGFGDAYVNLGQIQARWLDDLPGAERSFRRGVELLPGHWLAHRQLAALLLRTGRVSESLPHLEAALARVPHRRDIRLSLADALARLDRAGDAVRTVQLGLSLVPEDVQLRTRLAWLLATSRSDSVRAGATALALAWQLAAETRREDLAVLDTLAAAQAETGQFALAAGTADEALRKCEAWGLAEGVATFTGRRELYRRSQPLRDP
jgi:tetratricopeptide (TPR) repeat protein